MVAETNLTLTGRRAKLTEVDINAVADLVADSMLNEHEACLTLGIRPQTWYNWKARHKREGKFVNICARVRGSSIKTAMQAIKKAGDKDWRAHHARLQLIAPERFGNATGAAQVTGPVIALQDMAKALAMALDRVKPQAEVIDLKEIKQVTDKP